MEKNSFIESFGSDVCIECGICIKECRFRDSSGEKPALVFRAIKSGQESDYLSGCLSCMKCNHKCPRNAFPASLFLQKKYELREERNPVNNAVCYAINGKTGSAGGKNLFTDVYSRMNRKDRLILDRWEQPKDSRDLLFCGCASRLQPGLIENLHALDDIARFGGRNDCCGLFALKAGLFEEAKEISQNLLNRLELCSFDRLVFVCSSCLEMFRITMPRVLGIDIPFRTMSVYEYIHEKVAEGSLSIKMKHNFQAVLSDSCSGCELGEEYQAAVRALMKMTGIDIKEAVNNGNNVTCCGLPAFLDRGSLIDTLRARSIRIGELRKSGLDNVVTCCQGCSIMFDLPFAGFSTHYFLDLLFESLGDSVKRRNIITRFLNLSSISSFIKLLPWLFKAGKK